MSYNIPPRFTPDRGFCYSGLLFAKLVKIFESEGILTEEIRELHRKYIELKIANRH